LGAVWLARAARAALAVLLCAGACADRDAPEDRVRAVLASLEEAAEARDAAAMKEHVSERYRDARGQDRQAVAALVTFHFLRNRSVHLLTRVGAVTIAEPGEARVEALVAMAGAPIPSPEALVRLRADLYRFDLDLREEEGDWRVVSADWRRAALQDFFE
jgi:hypothetical protein